MYQFELTDPVCGYLLLELIKWYIKRQAHHKLFVPDQKMICI